MTVIAYRDGVMAADTGGWRGDAVMPWFRKVARGADGSLYGCAGSAGRVNAFLAWVDGGESGDMPLPAEGSEKGTSDFVVLIIDRNDRVGILTHEGIEVLHDAPYAAIGVCAEVCLGAMYAGGDAETAVRAALTHGSGATGSVMVVRR